MHWLARLLLYGAGGVGAFFLGREVLRGLGVGAFVPPRTLPLTTWSTKQGFVLSVLNASSAVWPQWPLEAKLLVIAQAAYESGWGKTEQAKQGNNILNVAAGTTEQPAPPSVWPGPVLVGGDIEHAPSGAVKKIRQRWRVYGSLEEALRDYWKLLGGKRYQGAQQALSAGDVNFLRVLGPQPEGCPSTRGCYFTLPTVKYLAQYLPVLAQVKGLVPASFEPPPRIA